MSSETHLTHNKRLKQLSQNLRNSATPEENHLWYDFLSAYEPRFHRQVTVKNYILDFYCPAAKLAVELDGSQHYEEEGVLSDTERTAVLEKLGIAVMRFSNNEVRKNFYGVSLMIDETVKKRVNW